MQKQKEEFESLIDRFSCGLTTKEEDLILLTAINSSTEFIEVFLNEIKVERIRQNIQGK